ncbi:conserved hypothetical protein [Ricinus communis]|uniref:Uncharacterized protein n=1 Tax=Ricinus communis TaxID=3988 RepID=B9SF42_RICCO|nr:conserved hypothetical protein [Ricinus communis]
MANKSITESFSSTWLMLSFLLIVSIAESRPFLGTGLIGKKATIESESVYGMNSGDTCFAVRCSNCLLSSLIPSIPISNVLISLLVNGFVLMAQQAYNHRLPSILILKHMQVIT